LKHTILIYFLFSLFFGIGEKKLRTRNYLRKKKLDRTEIQKLNYVSVEPRSLKLHMKVLFKGEPKFMLIDLQYIRAMKFLKPAEVKILIYMLEKIKTYKDRYYEKFYIPAMSEDMNLSVRYVRKVLKGLENLGTLDIENLNGRNYGLKKISIREDFYTWNIKGKVWRLFLDETYKENLKLAERTFSVSLPYKPYFTKAASC